MMARKSLIFNDLCDENKHILMNYMNGTLEADPDASAAKLTDILIGARCSSTLMRQITTMLTNIKKLYHAMRRENPREHVKDLLVAIINTMKNWEYGDWAGARMLSSMLARAPHVTQGSLCFMPHREYVSRCRRSFSWSPTGWTLTGRSMTKSSRSWTSERISQSHLITGRMTRSGL